MHEDWVRERALDKGASVWKHGNRLPTLDATGKQAYLEWSAEDGLGPVQAEKG